jgi:hypothetical protein
MAGTGARAIALLGLVGGIWSQCIVCTIVLAPVQLYLACSHNVLLFQSVVKDY